MAAFATLPDPYELPLTVPLDLARRYHAIGRDTAYRYASIGGLPFRVLRIGRKFRVTRAALLESLGLAPQCRVRGRAGRHDPIE